MEKTKKTKIYSRKNKKKPKTSTKDESDKIVANIVIENPSDKSDNLLEWLHDFYEYNNGFFDSDQKKSSKFTKNLFEIEKIYEIIRNQLGEATLELFKRQIYSPFFGEIDAFSANSRDLYIRPLKNKNLKTKNISDININDEFEKIVKEIKKFIDEKKDDNQSVSGTKEEEEDYDDAKSDVGSVTSDVGSVTTNVGSITSDVGSIASDVGSVTTNVGSITSSKEKEEENEKAEEKEEQKEKEENTEEDKIKSENKKIKEVKEFFSTNIYNNAKYENALLDINLKKYIKILEIILIKNFDVILQITQPYFILLKKIIDAFNKL